ncbi:hypothetical protein MY11210_008992 [Beauveria gryllotalpidicola]
MASPQEDDSSRSSKQAQEPQRLILCFDGTGNSFSGSNADTNVVKLLSMLDRTYPNQYHYYQELLKGSKIYIFGFSRGAYTAKFLARMINTVGLLCKGNEEMVPFAYLLYQRYLSGQLQDRTVEQKEQLKKATSLEQLMKAIPVEKLKSALTFNQLKAAIPVDQLKAAIPVDQLKAVMTVDQLKGAIPVDQLKAAMTVDQSVELIDVRTLEEVREERLNEESQPLLNAGNSNSGEPNEAFDELKAFSQTFCREETGKDGKGENIKVYFLGIWDCVSSVAVLEQKAPIPIAVIGTAHYVRHAVAVDERRVKFKPALLAQDIRDSRKTKTEDIKEVWFPGCHGDVGGGWPAGDDKPAGGDKAAIATENTMLWQRMTSWRQYIQKIWTSWKPKGPRHDVGADDFQMSDVPLAWMIHELELVDQLNPLAAVRWNCNAKRFKERFEAWFNKEKRFALGGFVHDSLSFGHGTGFSKVLLWRFMEYLPIITRWELRWTEIKPLWENVRFPLNKGRARDIPHDAVLHESLIRRLREDPLYKPANRNGRGTLHCLRRNDTIAQFTRTDQKPADYKHQTYKFVHVARKKANWKNSIKFWVLWAEDHSGWIFQLITACAIVVMGFWLVGYIY